MVTRWRRYTGVSVSGASTLSQIRQELEEQQARNSLSALEENTESDVTIEENEPAATTTITSEENIPQVIDESEQVESLANDHNDPNLPPTDSGDAILPGNMGLVNRIMQSKLGNAFIAATVVAFKEFKASMKPNFVDLHQSEAGRRGASKLR